MTAAHTPGPWRYGDLSESIITERARLIASLDGSEFWDAERAANGALIAAAPQLAEALRDAIAMCETLAASCSDRVHNTDGTIAGFRAALTAAGVKP